MPAFPKGPSGKPIPAGKLVSDVHLAWPWPYDAQALQAIEATVPPAARRKCREDVVLIGRRAITARTLQRQDPDGKPDRKSEINRLRAAVSELTAAAENVSPEAWDLIAQKADPHGPFRSMGTALEAIYRLRAEDISSENAPGASRGRPASDLLGRVLLDFEDAFIRAHGGTRPRKGFPTFRDACLEPLGFTVDVKTLEAQLQKARAHSRPTK